MTTLLSAVKFKGPCLTSGKESEIEIKPGAKGSGIIFKSANTSEQFSATTNFVLDTTHAVTIGTPSFYVKVAEHLMAALALSRIADAEIIVNSDEIPVGDGSAKVFYDLIKSAGIEPALNKTQYRLNNFLNYTHKHTSITAIPAEALRITYVVNYNNSPFANSWYKWESSVDKIEDIISARTFGYMKDLPVYQSMGLALGVTRDNTIGLNDDGTMTTELRYDNEPVRHKVLDLIGDLYLGGINPLDLKAHIIAIECGHEQHLQISKLLKDNTSLQ